MDIRNYFRMANMFSEENAMNPVAIPPEAISFLGEQGLGPMGRDTFTPNPHINPPIGAPQPGVVTEPPSVHANTQPPAPAPIAPSPAPAQPLDVQPQYGNEFFQRAQNEGLMERVGPVSPSSPTASNMSRIPEFQPMTRASDRVYDMLDQIPSPKPPGIARKFGASLVSLGVGPKEGRESLYGPYHTEYEQWQDRFKPTLDVANQERYYNANMRALYDNAVRAQQADARIDTANRRTDITERNVESQIASRESANRLRDWRREHPQGQVVVDRDGYIHIMDRTVGAEYPDTNTGVLSKDVDPITMENLRQRGRVQLEGQRQEGRMDLEGYRQERLGPPVPFYDQYGNPLPARRFTPSGRVEEAPTPEGAPEGFPRTTGDQTVPLETPAAQKTRWQNAAAMALQEHPEWADWIIFDPNNPNAYPDVLPPGEKSNRYWPWDSREEEVLTPELHQQIRQRIFGTGAQQPTRVPRPGGGGKPTQTPKQPKAGDIITAPNGMKLRFDGKGWERAQ